MLPVTAEDTRQIAFNCDAELYEKLLEGKSILERREKSHCTWNRILNAVIAEGLPKFIRKHQPVRKPVVVSKTAAVKKR